MKHDIIGERRNQIAVIGSGAYRIGSSVEFDWCCVTAVQAVNKCWLQINYD
ncbi:MAG: hypothetical protein MZV64_53555 [Ignavibacteriales bacterium]|nr:hypothetical protein [Ignavibacteriales bacterium]